MKHWQFTSTILCLIYCVVIPIGSFVSSSNLTDSSLKCFDPVPGAAEPVIGQNVCSALVESFHDSLPPGDLIWTTDEQLARLKPGLLPVGRYRVGTSGRCGMIIDTELESVTEHFSREILLHGALRIFNECFRFNQNGETSLVEDKSIWLELSTWPPDYKVK